MRGLTAHNLPQQARQTARARAAFVAYLGEDAASERAAEIAALPTVAWSGRTLYTLRCDADYGRGPHLQSVPQSMLWSLISLSHWRCPFHRC